MGPNPPCENDTLCGDWRGRCPKTEDCLRFFRGARATLCGDWRGRCPKTEDFLRFLSCTRDLLRGLAWWIARNASKMLLFQVGMRAFKFVSWLRACSSKRPARLESCLVSAAFKLESPAQIERLPCCGQRCTQRTCSENLLIETCPELAPHTLRR